MSGPPDGLVGRWRTVVVLKRDLFSTVERGMLDTTGGEIQGVLRRLDEVPWWSWLIARNLFNRERRALAIINDLGIAPPLVYSDNRRLVRGYIAGSPLKIARPFGDETYFRSARAALRALHRARITHNDLAKEQNWLRTPDGRAVLLDFQLASVFARRSFLFRLAAYEDLRHLLKHKRRYIPDTLTAAERRVLARKGLPTRIWMATGKRVYTLITRGVFGFVDGEGGGKRLAQDAPAIENALRTIPSVREAAVLDFPDRKRTTGLYAFVEADALLGEEEVRGVLARAVGAERLPEFVQIAEALPRRPDGAVRRDILRLISTNQVDLIAPLVNGGEETLLTERLVAARKNLYGAPTVVAAIMSHPQVADAAVMTYSDRVTGIGLYAFVETRGDLEEDRLADFVGSAIGRGNAPNFIQIVPALPRHASGRTRTDILQLIADNQVDSIDPLIGSAAERQAVDVILNARRNMRDRYVL